MSRLARLAPSLPLLLLVVAVSADRFGLRVRGLNLRLELLAAALLAAWILLTLPRRGLPPIGAIEWLLFGWLAAIAVASASFSPARSQSLKFTVLLAGMILLYGVTIALVRTTDDVARVATIWVGVGSAVAVIGIVEALLYTLAGTQVGIAFDGNVENNLVIITPKVAGPLWEANIFGSYLLAVWAVAFALGRTANFQSPGRRRFIQASLALSSCGVVLSMTRTAWVVAILLFLGVAVLAIRLGLLPRRRILADCVNPGLAGLAAGLILVIAMAIGQCPLVAAAGSPGPTGYASVGAPAAQVNPMSAPGCVRTGSAFLHEIGGLFHPGRLSSFTGRVSISKLALKGWLRRPILGWGAGSFLYVYGPQGGGWIGNLELHVLFDSGLIGFVLLVAAALVAGRRVIVALGIGVARWTPTHVILAGLVAGALALIATYQFTEGTWLGFTWVFFGMLVAAQRAALARPDHAAEVLLATPNGRLPAWLAWTRELRPRSPSA